MNFLSPIVAADVALFTILDSTLRVLLIQRDNEPQKGAWALPGALLKPDIDQSLEDTARRALAVKTHLKIPHLEQVSVFSGPDRDPRGYSISVIFYALLPIDLAPAVAGQKAKDVAWVPVPLRKRSIAFDHRHIIQLATARLQKKVEQPVLPLHLLPEKFTLTQLQQVCEAVLGRKLDKSSFRRKLKDDHTLVPISKEVEGGAYRPAQLYRAADGFRFESESEPKK